LVSSAGPTWRSTTSTSWPASARYQAVVTPMTPLPRTTTLILRHLAPSTSAHGFIVLSCCGRRTFLKRFLKGFLRSFLRRLLRRFCGSFHGSCNHRCRGSNSCRCSSNRSLRRCGNCAVHRCCRLVLQLAELIRCGVQLGLPLRIG